MPSIRFHARAWRAAALMIASVAAAGPAPAATTIGYLPQTFSTTFAYLVEVQSPTRVRVTNIIGSAAGSVTEIVGGRLATLDRPIAVDVVAADTDACGIQPVQRQETRQVLIRQIAGSPLQGRSEVVELGTLTNLTGCEVGKVTPFGSLDEAGLPTRHLTLAQRPPVTDLGPGVDLAGPKEAPKPADNPYDTLSADVVRFLPGGRVRFSATGLEVPAVPNADGWLVLQMPGFQRGYLRLFVDPTTGAEAWLQAEFANGRPATVEQALMVKAQSGASFGTVVQASRRWESGLFVGTAAPFAVYLYSDFTGDRVSLDPITGQPVYAPITWGFDGLDIVQDRPAGVGVTARRTWVPLRNNGIYRFVIEREDLLFSGGQNPRITPRVNFYIDRGRAVPPSATIARASAPDGAGRPGRAAP